MTNGTEHPWRPSRDGVALAVRLTPKSSTDTVVGIEASAAGPRLAVKVRAIPDKGEANAALLAVLAKWLRLPKSRFELAAGGKSRSKTVAIAGDGAEITQLLSSRLQVKTKGDQ